MRRGWTGAIQPLRRRRPRVHAAQRADRAQLCGVPGTRRAQRWERRGGTAVPPRVLLRLHRDVAAAASRVRVSMPRVRAAAAAQRRVRDGPRGRHEERREALWVRVRRPRGEYLSIYLFLFIYVRAISETACFVIYRLSRRGTGNGSPPAGASAARRRTRSRSSGCGRIVRTGRVTRRRTERIFTPRWSTAFTTLQRICIESSRRTRGIS